MNDLEMSKEHFQKVSITDIAIEKVPYIKYHGLSEKQCEIIPTRTSKASSSDLRKAQMRGHLFAVKHGL